MKLKYILKSGEEIDLRLLSQYEVEHIKILEQCVSKCLNHNRTDYFYVYKKAFESMNIGGNKKQLEKLFNSPYYRVVMDFVSRYRDKCFIDKKIT